MYRIGQEEIAAVSRVIETRDMFKINGGLQESKKESTSDIHDIMKEVKQTDFAGKRNFVVSHIDKAFISRTKPNEDETEFHIVFK